VFVKLLALAGAAGLAVPAGAQVANVDPNGPPPPAAAQAPDKRPVPEWQSAATPAPPDRNAPPAAPVEPAPPPAEQGREIAFQRAHAEVTNQSVANKDVLSAAEGVFGKGANGLADMIEKLLKDQVHWTGPSVGFDFGADANKVFVLVYNLNDTQRLFRRFPAAEGNAYVVGGLTASYLRSGDMVLIPIRMGVGARLGINAGYMKFSQKSKWLPF
jgi:hypothetical protein